MKKIFKAAKKVLKNGIPLEGKEVMLGFGFSKNGELFVSVHDLEDNSIGINGLYPQPKNLWVVWFLNYEECREWLRPFCAHHINTTKVRARQRR